MPRERTSETGRKKRVPFGTPEARLSAPKRDGFYRRWFNDTPGRVQRALDAGYALVRDETFEEDEDGKKPAVSRVVGTNEDGSPMHAILMELPMELWDQDQKVKQAPLDEFDDALRRGNIRGADERDNSSFYVPDEGISVRND